MNLFRKIERNLATFTMASLDGVEKRAHLRHNLYIKSSNKFERKSYLH